VLAPLSPQGKPGWVAADRDELPGPARIFGTGPFPFGPPRRGFFRQSGPAAWVDRVSPFIDDGRDVYVFFRHTDEPTAPRLALRFAELAAAAIPAEPVA